MVPQPALQLGIWHPTRGCAWATFLALIVFFVWLYLGYRQSKYLLPPEETATLAALASAPPPTRKLALIEDKGARYFVWIGRTRTVLLASGPPVYVFDAAGRLVARSIDIGDSSDQHVRRYFGLALNGRELTFADALKMIVSVAARRSKQ